MTRRFYRVGFVLAAIAAATTLSSAATPASGAAAAKPRTWRLKAGDAFAVRGALVGCLVQNQAGFSTSLICFKQTRRDSFRPHRGTYVLDYEEAGFSVFYLPKGKGPLQRVLTQRQPTAQGTPPLAAGAWSHPPGAGQLKRDDQVFLLGTHIACRALKSAPGLACLEGGSNGITVNSYAAVIGDAGITITRMGTRGGVEVASFKNRA